MNIFPLSEGVFTIGHDKKFIPFNEEQDELNDRSIGSLLVEIQPFLVQINHQNILFDTGLGYKLPNGELLIHHNIRALGIEPNEIHKVILSHLHKDHAGGISYINEQGEEVLSFPNATYFVIDKEFDFAVENAGKSYTLEDFAILKSSMQTEWLSEKGTIEGLIDFEVTGGHCPFHCCFLIRDEDEKAFFGADVAPQLKQLKTKYVAKYDFDGKRSMELRQEFAQKGKDENWTFMFYHDVKTPIGML